MDAEQVVRGYFEGINAHDASKVASYLADDFAETFPEAPPLNKQHYLEHIKTFFEAFSDWNFHIEKVIVAGDYVAAEVRVSGTHDGPLPGTPPIPPTGKKFSVPDKMLFTLNGEKIATMQIQSPAGGGPAEAVKQLGIQSS